MLGFARFQFCRFRFRRVLQWCMVQHQHPASPTNSIDVELTPHAQFLMLSVVHASDTEREQHVRIANHRVRWGTGRQITNRTSDSLLSWHLEVVYDFACLQNFPLSGSDSGWFSAVLFRLVNCTIKHAHLKFSASLFGYSKFTKRNLITISIYFASHFISLVALKWEGTTEEDFFSQMKIE